MADNRPKTPPAAQVQYRADLQSVLELDEQTLQPGMHYRFVQDHPLRVARHRMKGYVPVTKEEGVRTLVDTGDSPDGIVRVGDTILMKCDKSSVAARRKEQTDRSEARLNSYRVKAKEQINRAGLTFIEDKE